MWFCVCDCGTVKTLSSETIASGIKSCGCIKRKSNASKITKHGMLGTKTYWAWRKMKARCMNPNIPCYKHYGCRGIKVCDRWIDSFENFLADMGEAPVGTSLDRYPDMNGNYEPGNCRWATPKEQSRNKRNNRFVEYLGSKKTVAEWSEITNIDKGTIVYRLNAGWSAERALSTPAKSK
jgi:hypothetical protein